MLVKEIYITLKLLFSSSFSSLCSIWEMVHCDRPSLEGKGLLLNVFDHAYPNYFSADIHSHFGFYNYGVAIKNKASE